MNKGGIGDIVKTTCTKKTTVSYRNIQYNLGQLAIKYIYNMNSIITRYMPISYWFISTAPRILGGGGGA